MIFWNMDKEVYIQIVIDFYRDFGRAQALLFLFKNKLNDVANPQILSYLRKRNITN
ncbi:hypothetical protein M272_15425 [Vibrio natriegens NBRC 15636 = ATCC 14048 = DSM 759]|nr:hypothetical protein M272_15425 [Vibrio natriegens NBRC 15636 = ATCC 14048 = DSM 759]